MIRAKIEIPDYDWTVYCYFSKSCYYVSEIIAKLKEIDINADNLSRAYRSLASCKLDTGLCYTNKRRHCSVLVTSASSSAAEFLNSLTHEISHLVAHICEEWGVDQQSEEPCYLAGDIAELMHPYIKSLLCNKCRRIIGVPVA